MATAGVIGEEARRRVVVSAFHDLFYRDIQRSSPGWSASSRHAAGCGIWWMGVPIMKCPTDLWMYQQIIFDTRPDVVVETGTGDGASAHFMACVCDLVGHGLVLTVDRDPPDPVRLPHERIAFLAGDSVSGQVVEAVRAMVGPDDRAMVVLDSDHSAGHVFRELELYSPFVGPGCYLVVEDSDGEGPSQAVARFLPSHTEFRQDRSRERFLLTYNPGGYLLRA